MQFRPSDNSFASDEFPEDDIDRLFQKLSPLEVPEGLLEQVFLNLYMLSAHQDDTEAEQPSYPKRTPGLFDRFSSRHLP